MSRPALALAVIGLSVGAILGGCAGTYYPTNARRAYLRLPHDVPATFSGAPAADAAYSLVHIRQRHLPPDIEMHASREQRLAWIAAVNDHQREVHEILRAFVDVGDVDSVLAEGVYVEDPWDDAASIEVDYLERLRVIDRASAMRGGDHAVETYHRLRRTPAALFALDDEIADLPESRLRGQALAFAAVKYAPGAEHLLALEGRLRVLPAERWDLIQAATGAHDRLPRGASHLAAADPALFDDREDEVLRRLVAAPRPLSVVLFGGLHDFSDNVESWNARHPDERIDLVVVTPNSY